MALSAQGKVGPRSWLRQLTARVHDSGAADARRRWIQRLRRTRSKSSSCRNAGSEPPSWLFSRDRDPEKGRRGALTVRGRGAEDHSRTSRARYGVPVEAVRSRATATLDDTDRAARLARPGRLRSNAAQVSREAGASSRCSPRSIPVEVFRSWCGTAEGLRTRSGNGGPQGGWRVVHGPDDPPPSGPARPPRDHRAGRGHQGDAEDADGGTFRQAGHDLPKTPRVVLVDDTGCSGPGSRAELGPAVEVAGEADDLPAPRKICPDRRLLCRRGVCRRVHLGPVAAGPGPVVAGVQGLHSRKSLFSRAVPPPSDAR